MSASAGLPVPSPTMLARLYRLSVAQYHKMIEFGILTTEDRVELIEGLLIWKHPPSPAHDKAVRAAAEACRKALSRPVDGQAIEHIPVNDPPG